MKKVLKSKLFKSVILMWLLVLTTLTFSACAQVTATTITNTDDTIDELVTISLNAQAVMEAGYDLSEVKLDISNNSLSIAEQMANELEEKIARDSFLATEETKEILNGFKDGIEIVKSDWNNNTYAIGIRFKNIDVYKYYYSIKENNKTEVFTEEHFFYDKVYYYGYTMFLKFQGLYTDLNEYYSNKYPNLVNSETNKLMYSYRTDLRRQHSDADYVTYDNGEYVHTWVVDKDQIDEPIMLYYNVANPENYIIVSLFIVLGITIVMLVVACAVHLVKNKHKN